MNTIEIVIYKDEWMELSEEKKQYLINIMKQKYNLDIVVRGEDSNEED